MPELAILNERSREGVKYIPCTNPRPYRTIGLIYRPGSPLKARYQRVAELIGNNIKPLLVTPTKRCLKMSGIRAKQKEKTRRALIDAAFDQLSAEKSFFQFKSP